MGDTPRFIRVPKVFTVVISTANTALDGTGTLGTLATGASASQGIEGGTLIKRITAKAQGTTTAGVLRFFIDGELFREELVTAITPSDTVKSYEATLAWPTASDPLHLGDGQVLEAGTHNAEAFAITASGGDL